MLLAKHKQDWEQTVKLNALWAILSYFASTTELLGTLIVSDYTPEAAAAGRFIVMHPACTPYCRKFSSKVESSCPCSARASIGPDKRS
jgi:hypothetical protein